MKMMKRIFVAVLIVSIMMSIFALSVSAADDKDASYEYILEHFEEPTLFYYDFTGEDVDCSSSMLIKRPKSLTQAYVTDETAPGGKYLSFEIASATNKLNAYADNNVYFSWSGENAIDDFMIDMTVSGSKGSSDKEQTLPRIIVAIGSEAYTDAAIGSTQGTTILAIDYRNGYFSYLKRNLAQDGTVSGVETNTSFVIEENAWYNVSLSVKDGSASIKIVNVDDPEKSITVADVFLPINEIRDVRVGCHGTDSGSARGSVMKFANVFGLAGQYKRVPSNKQADVEAALIKMFEDFQSENVSIEKKIAICDIAEKIVDYGFTSENGDVNDALTALSIGIIGLYNEKIAICVDVCPTLPTYAEKRALLDETLGFADSLAEMDLSGITDELLSEINENVAKLKEVDSQVKAVAEVSEQYIAEVNAVRDSDLTNYPALLSVVEKLSALDPDYTYDGVGEAKLFYDYLVDTEALIRNSADTFINKVAIAADVTLGINERADAFRAIASVYYDNETYPGVTEALATYAAISPEMITEISNGDNFIKYVNKADYAIYVSAKQENLNIAKGYMDVCHPDYRGVAEAKLLYAEVQEQVNSKIASAKAYIDAVNALDSLSGDALKAAIDKANNLKQAGNVLGVEGVTEANIKLNKAEASLDLGVRYAEHFVRVVATIDSAKTASDLYSILKEAKNAEVDADASYPGVKDASAKLASAISNYNKQVSEANAEFARASEVAANTCGIGVESNTVADHVIALIKKFFDEE